MKIDYNNPYQPYGLYKSAGKAQLFTKLLDAGKKVGTGLAKTDAGKVITKGYQALQPMGKAIQGAGKQVMQGNLANAGKLLQRGGAMAGQNLKGVGSKAFDVAAGRWGAAMNSGALSPGGKLAQIGSGLGKSLQNAAEKGVAYGDDILNSARGKFTKGWQQSALNAADNVMTHGAAGMRSLGQAASKNPALAGAAGVAGAGLLGAGMLNSDVKLNSGLADLNAAAMADHHFNNMGGIKYASVMHNRLAAEQENYKQFLYGICKSAKKDEDKDAVDRTTYGRYLIGKDTLKGTASGSLKGLILGALLGGAADVTFGDDSNPGLGLKIGAGLGTLGGGALGGYVGFREGRTKADMADFNPLKAYKLQQKESELIRNQLAMLQQQ